MDYERYQEVTSICDTHRSFLELKTGKIIKCICPYMPGEWTRNLDRKVEANVKDCIIHGW